MYIRPIMTSICGTLCSLSTSHSLKYRQFICKAQPEPLKGNGFSIQTASCAASKTISALFKCPLSRHFIYCLAKYKPSLNLVVRAGIHNNPLNNTLEGYDPRCGLFVFRPVTPSRRFLRLTASLVPQDLYQDRQRRLTYLCCVLYNNATSGEAYKAIGMYSMHNNMAGTHMHDNMIPAIWHHATYRVSEYLEVVRNVSHRLISRFRDLNWPPRF
jgi:hypothetical protein